MEGARDMRRRTRCIEPSSQNSLFITRLLYVAAEHTSPEPAEPPLFGAMAASRRAEGERERERAGSTRALLTEMRKKKREREKTKRRQQHFFNLLFLPDTKD